MGTVPCFAMAPAPAIDESVFGDPAISGTTDRWDSIDTQSLYNWSTKGFAIGFFWRIGVPIVS